MTLANAIVAGLTWAHPTLLLAAAGGLILGQIVRHWRAL